MKKKQKNKIINYIPDIIRNSYIEIFGNEEIVITGKNEIIQLERSVIKIKCNELIINFEGKELNIANYDYNGVTIKGKLKKIEFERG